ncbi:hypothetical protein LIER_01932 [Lithospermum erythrorhizon]|uniref:RNase H type-1 domain-containing protein n=1 Tax=Lithospermum erythrorhizon TaxID=34254 RepID=A0AAV3NSE7_LITER
MSNPSMMGSLTTWAIELTEFEVSYVPRTNVKAQALADFLIECTACVPEEVLGPREGRPEEVPWWKLHVDEASNEKRSRAGILIEGPEGEVFEYALRFSFKSTNNEAEYEVMVTGLQIAQALKIQQLLVRGDSKLVIEQIRGDCGVKSEVLKKYHAKALTFTRILEYLSFEHIPDSQNKHVDHLSRLATTYFGDLSSGVHVEVREHLIHMDCNVYSYFWKKPRTSEAR